MTWLDLTHLAVGGPALLIAVLLWRPRPLGLVQALMPWLFMLIGLSRIALTQGWGHVTEALTGATAVVMAVMAVIAGSLAMDLVRRVRPGRRWPGGFAS